MKGWCASSRPGQSSTSSTTLFWSAGPAQESPTLSIALARALIRNGARGRFFNVVDLVNRLETEARNGKQGRLADVITRLDFVIMDELGYPPSLRPAASFSSI
jgi:hypothetical protein